MKKVIIIEHVKQMENLDENPSLLGNPKLSKLLSGLG
jgi:hypothetical protein